MCYNKIATVCSPPVRRALSPRAKLIIQMAKMINLRAHPSPCRNPFASRGSEALEARSLLAGKQERGAR